MGYEISGGTEQLGAVIWSGDSMTGGRNRGRTEWWQGWAE